MPLPTKVIRAVFYQAKSGREPVRDWLLSELSLDDRKTIGADIATVEYGWPIGMPVSRSLGQGLREVRSQLSGNRISRVIFFIAGSRMILLHGFIKKSQRTPKPDLDLALKRRKEIEV